MTEDSKELKIPVVGGLCTIHFTPGSNCGRKEGTNPGVAFMLVSTVGAFERNGKYYSGSGVFSRNDAQKLVDMLSEFLKEHPAK